MNLWNFIVYAFWAAVIGIVVCAIYFIVENSRHRRAFKRLCRKHGMGGLPVIHYATYENAAVFDDAARQALLYNGERSLLVPYNKIEYGAIDIGSSTDYVRDKSFSDAMGGYAWAGKTGAVIAYTHSKPERGKIIRGVTYTVYLTDGSNFPMVLYRNAEGAGIDTNSWGYNSTRESIRDFEKRMNEAIRRADELA